MNISNLKLSVAQLCCFGLSFLVEEKWENERYWGFSWGSPGVADRKRWSDKSGENTRYEV